MKKIIMMGWIKNIERNSSENTVMAYMQNVNQLYNYFEEKIDTSNELEFIKSIDNGMIEKYIEELEKTYARSSINQKIITWNLFFDYCKKTKGIITINPLENMRVYSSKKIKETEKKKYIPTKEEIEKLINACDSKTGKEKNFDLISRRNRAIISILATTGLRISELAKTKVTDLEELEDAIMINVSADRVKTEVDKRVPITGIALKHFKDYMLEKKLSKFADSEFVFISKNGKEINRRNYNDILDSIIEKANINTGEASLSVHCLRHFTASMITRDSNNSIMAINSLMGWSNGGMVQRYSHQEFFDREKIDMCKRILA